MESTTESRQVARAAIMMAVSASRSEEAGLDASFRENGILTGAADYGGEFVPNVMKIIDRAISCGKREGLISENDHEIGALAGAAHEALAQIAPKALGLSIGGKIGIARKEGHIAVAVFLCIGLGHLDEMCTSIGHRVI